MWDRGSERCTPPSGPEKRPWPGGGALGIPSGAVAVLWPDVWGPQGWLLAERGPRCPEALGLTPQGTFWPGVLPPWGKEPQALRVAENF